MSYNIGLDIKTDGVGWSITDPEGELLKKNNHHLFGTSVFDEAETSEERRRYRTQRRQRDRRECRINVLQRLMESDVLHADPVFYLRLDESSLDREDRTVQNLYRSLPEYVFEDQTGKIKEQGNASIRIYQLRDLLIKNRKKADIRYVYMAIAHILKHRGYITEEEETPEIRRQAAANHLEQYLQYINEKQILEPVNVTVSAIYALLDAIVEEKENTQRITDVISDQLLAYGKSSDAIQAAVELLTGGSVEISRIILNKRKKGEVSFATLRSSQVFDKLNDEATEAVSHLQVIYEWLREIWIEKEKPISVSEEMNARYEVHKKDLSELKAWFKKYADKEEYQQFFHTDGVANNYNAYTRSRTGETNNSDKWYHCTQGAFYNNLRVILLKYPEGKDDAEKMLKRMFTAEDGEVIPNGFLPLQRINLNSSIENVRHIDELKIILKNQAEYYPSLRENTEKIISLCTFRIPYFVGPLKQGKSSPFDPWIQYKAKSTEHILPWDLEKRVDIPATAERFVDRVTNHCTFFYQEKVLPKHSMIYEEYMLLSELNQLYVLFDDPARPAARQESIDGSGVEPQEKGKERRTRKRTLSEKTKKRLIEEVFSEQKRVSVGSLIAWLERNAFPGKKNLRLLTSEGKPIERIYATLSARVDMKNILGRKIDPEKEPNLEKIIKWSTIYTDRKIYVNRLMSEMKDKYTEEQLKRFAGLRYEGWGRFSRALLCDPLCEYEGRKVSVLNRMRKRHDTFMRIYHEDKYELKTAVRARNLESEEKEIEYRDISLMAVSPALRRAMWTSVKIINEITQYMKEKPAHIFIRNMRDANARKRILSDKNITRYERIRESYNNYEKTTGKKIDPALKIMLQGKKNENITDTEYLYLLQLGKCVYTGEKIDLQKQSNYFIDYAVPLYLTTDETLINNRVLVLKNKRTPGRPLTRHTISTMRPFWEHLRDSGLMAGHKFNGLIIDQYDEDTYRYFFRNQLTANSLLIEKMTWILKKKYTESVIYGINARLTEQFRKKQDLYKIATMNNMQQAYDAFLTANIGSFVAKFMPEYLRDGDKKQIIIKKREHKGDVDKNGIFCGSYFGMKKDEKGNPTKDPLYPGEEEREKCLKTAYSLHDGYVTRKTVEYTGKFYHETLYRPEKTERPTFLTNKNGSYKHAYIAYMDLIQYRDKDGEEWKEIISIPAFIAQKPEKIADYIERELGYNQENGYSEVKIIRDKILLNQEVVIEGHPYYLRSSSEWINARQLFIKEEYAKIICRAMSVKDPWNNYIAEPEEADKMKDAAKYLIEKYLRLYPIHMKLGKSVAGIKGKIEETPVQDVVLLIQILVNSMGTRGERIQRIAKQMKTLLVEGDNRISNKTVKAKEIEIIDRSVTGLYSKRTIY